MKKIIYSLLGLILLSVILFFYSKNYFSPIYKGQLKLSILERDASIYYDDYGIPHIEAKNRKDLYKAYGFAVMQDRFFQIQFQKMIASGRLSEWFGYPTLETDKTLRTLSFKYRMTKWYEENKNKLNPDLMEDLKSWLEGVNECIKVCAKPIEMVILRVDPEPLEIEDVLAFSAVMSFSFTKAYFNDAILTQLSQSITPNMLSEISGQPLSTPLSKSKPVSLNSKSLLEIDPLSFIPHLDGSQSWVLSSDKSESGHTTLANDPHIAFSNPGVWYEAHLKSEDFELYGHFIPIIPFALIGHNQHKAWALTMSYADELDLLIPNEKTVFTKRIENIKIKNKNSFELVVLQTEVGPVIDSILKTNEKAIMYWHYYKNDNFVIESFYDLARAKSLDDFSKAIAKGKAPGLNVSWADKEGNIAWKMLGYFPKRKLPFWSTKDFNDLEPSHEYYDEKVIPSLTNPKQGYILSANQKPPVIFDENKISGYWESSERYNALHERLEKHDVVSIDMQKKLFVDNTFWGAQERFENLLSEVTPDSKYMHLLRGWDGESNLKNTSQAFYFMWVDEIMKLVLNSHLTKTEQEQLCSSSLYWKFATRIIDNPQSEWWKNNRSKIIQAAFESTLKYFIKNYGENEDGDSWQWGKLHTLTFEHPLGKVKPLNWIFNIGPYPTEGGYQVPNAFRHALCKDNFKVTSGPSTRRIIDFQNPQEALGVLPTGNSGVPFSKHYKDQVQLFLNGSLRSETMNWDKIKKFEDKLELLAN